VDLAVVRLAGNVSLEIVARPPHVKAKEKMEMLQRMRRGAGVSPLMVMGRASGTPGRGPVTVKQRRETRSNRPLAPRSASARLIAPGGELAAGLGIWGVRGRAGPHTGAGMPPASPGSSRTEGYVQPSSR